MNTVRIDPKILKLAEQWGKDQSPQLNKKQTIEFAVLKLVKKKKIV